MQLRVKMLAYNAALKKARILIEHAFGLLKRRFPALLYMLRPTKLENTQAIIGMYINDHPARHANIHYFQKVSLFPCFCQFFCSQRLQRTHCTKFVLADPYPN
jgi:hypothetical protein